MWNVLWALSSFVSTTTLPHTPQRSIQFPFSDSAEFLCRCFCKISKYIFNFNGKWRDAEWNCHFEWTSRLNFIRGFFPLYMSSFWKRLELRVVPDRWRKRDGKMLIILFEINPKSGMWCLGARKFIFGGGFWFPCNYKYRIWKVLVPLAQLLVEGSRNSGNWKIMGFHSWIFFSLHEYWVSKQIVGNWRHQTSFYQILITQRVSHSPFKKIF